MGKYFTIPELCASAVAVREGIDNTPPPSVKVNLAALITNCLDPIREKWGSPIIVNSGFRNPTLNKKVGGSPKSQHMTGEAADITTGRVGENKRLFDMIRKSGIPFDQLIDESDYAWIHVSWRSGGNNRGEVLHLKD